MKKIFAISALITAPFIYAGNALAQQGGYGGGPGWQHPMMWGGGWFGGPIMMIFWLLVIVAIIFGIRWAVKDRGTSGDGRSVSPGSGGRSAMEVLKRRYASGEIDRDQYLAMKEDLEE